ncbi:MAG: histidine kinase [Ignavibacteriales bacterium]|nr:histidine kinase [Ignavibacteriales bacterium]
MIPNKMLKVKTKKRIKFSLIMFGVATVIGLMSFAVVVTTELAENFTNLTSKDFVKISYPLVDELTGAYTFVLLLPLLLIFFKRVPLTKENWFHKFPLYLIASIIVGLTHTSMMYISRSIIYPILHWGNYDYGYIPFRIVMEYLKQFVIFWGVFTVYALIKTFQEKEAHKIKTAQLEEQLTKARLETLKMQLNPHFLFNTLNMISSTMYEDTQAADKMIANLSDLLRITLKSSSKGENILAKEIDILNLYIEIMKARFKDKLEIVLQIDEETIEALVPNFIFQPLVENSIKYGMENLTSTKIEVSAKKSLDKLIIKIRDNGPGIQKENAAVLNSGVGLSNTVERLEKLYGNNFEFNWVNLDEGGLLLTIEIPFKEEEEQN